MFKSSVLLLLFLSANIGCATLAELTGPSAEVSVNAWDNIDKKNGNGWDLVFPEKEHCFDKSGSIIDRRNCERMFFFKNDVFPKIEKISEFNDSDCSMMIGREAQYNLESAKKCKAAAEIKLSSLDQEQAYLNSERELLDQYIPISIEAAFKKLDSAKKIFNNLVKSSSEVISRDGFSPQQLERKSKIEKFKSASYSKYKLSLSELNYLIVRSDGVDSWGQDLGATIFDLENSSRFKVVRHNIKGDTSLKIFTIYMSNPNLEHEIKIVFKIQSKYAILSEVAVGPDSVSGFRVEAALYNFIL